MRSRATRRIVSTTVTAALAVGLTGFGLGPAQALQAAEPVCGTINPASGSAADVRAAVNTLTSCLDGLQKAADAAGRTAQVADEQYLRAKGAATAAAARYARAQQAADRATAAALKSRARASVVAANLARSGSADQAANLLLDGGGATKVLYRVSRMSQLSMQSTQIFDQARRDEHAATVLAARASNAATSAQSAAETASAALADAKRKAAAVASVVAQQRSRQRGLQAELAALEAQAARAATARAAQARPVVRSSVSAPSATPAASVPLSASSATAPHASAASTPLAAAPAANASVAARVIAFARAQIGEPYVLAAAGPNAWDCSGLTMGAYASVGIGIGGHSTTAQYGLAAAQGKLVPYANRQPGDLLFYSDGSGTMYHVAIYVGGGSMIEAPYEGQNVREVPVRSFQLVGQVARFSG